MKPLALVLLAILVVVALRHREPDRAEMRRDESLMRDALRRRGDRPLSSYPSLDDVLADDDDGIQPADPYPASLLR